MSDAPTASDFEAWSAGLPQQDIHNAVKLLVPKGTVKTYKAGKSKINFYYKVRTPSNFAAVGDSLAHFKKTSYQKIHRQPLSS